MERILCWSTGKDSTATAILAKKHGEKIDEIMSKECKKITIYAILLCFYFRYLTIL
jgi:tRNA(Ile)-lysidine synthase TilS/MesJ